MKELELKKRFRLAATPAKDEPKIRDKDNGKPRPTPPSYVTKPAPNVAPFGMLGIKRTSQIGPSLRKKPEKRFKLGYGDDLVPEFKTVAEKKRDKNDRGRER